MEDKEEIPSEDSIIARPRMSASRTNTYVDDDVNVSI